MKPPFVKFVVHAQSVDSFTVHVQGEHVIPHPEKSKYVESLGARRDFIESAIQEKIEREQQKEQP